MRSAVLEDRRTKLREVIDSLNEAIRFSDTFKVPLPS